MLKVTGFNSQNGSQVQPQVVEVQTMQPILSSRNQKPTTKSNAVIYKGAVTMKPTSSASHQNTQHTDQIQHPLTSQYSEFTMAADQKYINLDAFSGYQDHKTQFKKRTNDTQENDTDYQNNVVTDEDLLRRGISNPSQLRNRLDMNDQNFRFANNHQDGSRLQKSIASPVVSKDLNPTRSQLISPNLKRSAAALSGEMQVFPNGTQFQSLKQPQSQFLEYVKNQQFQLQSLSNKTSSIVNNQTPTTLSFANQNPSQNIVNHSPLLVPTIETSQQYNGQNKIKQKKSIASTQLVIDQKNIVKSGLPQMIQGQSVISLQQRQQQDQEFKMLLKGQRMTVGSNEYLTQVEKTRFHPLSLQPQQSSTNGMQQCQSPPRLGILNNPNQIFENNSAQPSYHFIYDYLFVQVSTALYEKDYAHRIKLFSSPSLPHPTLQITDISDNVPIEIMAKESQFTQLRVLKESDVIEGMHEDFNDETMAKILQDTTTQLIEQGKKFKVTVKKNYINDILMYSKGAQNVSQKIIIIVSDQQLTLNNVQKPKQIKKKIHTEADQASGGASENEDEKQLQQQELYQKGKKTPQNRRKKDKATAVINQSRGYESENEKSTDTQSTSSTLVPLQFKRTTTVGSDAETPISKKKNNIPKSTKPNRKDDSRLSLTHEDFSQAKGALTVMQPENSESKYGPTKIKIWHKWEPQDEIKNHPIQKMFNAYNDFVKIVFIQRAIYENNYKQKLPQLLKLAKKLGFSLIKNQLLPSNLKVRENSNSLKERIVYCWCRIIAQTNQFEANIPGIFNKKINEQTKQLVEKEQSSLAIFYNDQIDKSQLQQHYKVFVGKGNNSVMVRSLFKSRYWWLLHDKEELDKVNFMWTQCRKQDIMKQIKCKLVTVKDSTDKTSPRKHKRISSQSNLTAEKSQPVPEVQPISRHVTEAVPQKMELFPSKIYNKLEDNYHLSNKKALFLNMRFYYEALGQDPFSALPVTFHVKSGLEDPEFHRFKAYFNDALGEKTNIWIIKPGENTNRGQGISVSKDYAEITSLIEESTKSKRRTCIVQKYISNPLLINKRKFDIRSYATVTSINGNMKGYFYDEGYLRTSSREFSISNLSNKFVHLTNDAIQKKAEDYGKYENGNKLSYVDFQNYLDKNHTEKNICFERDLLPQLKTLTSDCMKAVWGKMDPNKRVNTFEVSQKFDNFWQVFGLDFMFDDEFKPYLIEVNTNPCLELSSPLLARLIPNMLENAFRIVADPMFPPPEGFSQKKQVVHELTPENKFHLVFDEKVDGPGLESVFRTKENVIVEIDEEEISDEEVVDEM